VVDDASSKRFFAFVEIKSPPMGTSARRKTGLFLRQLQEGEELPKGAFTSMRGIGKRCYELYIDDAEKGCSWRVVYHVGREAIVVLDCFKKKSEETPQRYIERCRKRLDRWYAERA